MREKMERDSRSYVVDSHIDRAGRLVSVFGGFGFPSMRNEDPQDWNVHADRDSLFELIDLSDVIYEGVVDRIVTQNSFYVPRIMPDDCRLREVAERMNREVLFTFAEVQKWAGVSWTIGRSRCASGVKICAALTTMMDQEFIIKDRTGIVTSGEVFEGRKTFGAIGASLTMTVDAVVYLVLAGRSFF